MTYRRGIWLCLSVLIGISVLMTHNAIVAQTPIDPLRPPIGWCICRWY